MEKDNYQWWQKRFRKMAEYFTAYRIDHILGFFRIWEIPSHSVHGLLGQFVPALPMSVDEIQSYGLTFQKDFMTKPFINENILNRIFGEKAGMVKETFVRHCHDDIYEMRSEFDTQRKVESYFADRKDEESRNICEGLYALISNVLFVPDRKHPSMYHPRIAVQNDFIFEVLSWGDKEAFNRLYNHYYYQRHNQFWYQEAMKKLPILTQSTSMLVCGEDLGMVPDCVPWVMEQLQILSLEIQRMPKNPQHEFGHVWEYPYRSVCTISTHDMSTLRGWWEEDYEQTCRYYNQVMGHWGEVPATAPGWVCEEIVRSHLECPSLLCILSFQDWLSMDEEIRYPDVNAERINVPANPRHYWRYRMHLTLEELMKSDKFNEKMKEMIDANEFRSDLYYRLNVVNLEIPPLRERKKDIIPLAQHFLNQFNAKFKTHKTLSPYSCKTLEEYNWPGNVRELKNTIEKMVILSDEDIISSAELWSSESSLIKDNVQLGNIQLKTILEQIELKYIREYCSLYGTLEKTAEKLDMNLKTLSRRKKHLEEKYPRSENL